MPASRHRNPKSRPFYEGFLSPEEEAAADLIARGRGEDPLALKNDLAVVHLNAALREPASPPGNRRHVYPADPLRVRLDGGRYTLFVEGVTSVDFSGAPEAWKDIKLLYRARALVKGEGGVRWLDKDKGRHNKRLAALRAKLDTESPGLGHKLIANVRGKGVKLACEIIPLS